MRILRIILISLAALIGLALIASLLTAKEVTTSRSIVINAPQEVVFNTVNNLKSWEDWSPWKEMEPDMQISYGASTVGEGASYSWVGEETGSGTMSIAASNPSESITTLVEFDGQGNADGEWTFEQTPEGTQTTWGFHSKFPVPFNLMLLFMDIEKFVGKDFERGLTLLKEKIESETMNNPTTNGFDIQTVDLPLHHFVGVKETVSMDEMGDHYQTILPKVYEAVQKAGLESAGQPCNLYYTWDEEKGETEMALSIPTKGAAAVDGYTSLEVPQQKALLIEYYGAYEGLKDPHMAIGEYMEANNMEFIAPCIEQYETDPTTEPDTSKWLTRIYYPIK